MCILLSVCTFGKRVFILVRGQATDRLYAFLLLFYNCNQPTLFCFSFVLLLFFTNLFRFYPLPPCFFLSQRVFVSRYLPYSSRFYFFLLFIINLSHLFLFLPSNSTLSLIPPRSFFPPLFATSPSRTSSTEPLHACTTVQFPRSTDNPIYTSDYSRGGFEPPHPKPGSNHHHPSSLPSMNRGMLGGEIYFLSLSLYERLKHGRFPASTFAASCALHWNVVARSLKRISGKKEETRRKSGIKESLIFFFYVLFLEYSLPEKYQSIERSRNIKIKFHPLLPRKKRGIEKYSARHNFF